MTAAVATLVSRYVGLVRGLDELLADTSDARLPSFVCDAAADVRILGARTDHLGGIGGVGRDRAEASAAALGEFAERYSACYLPSERLVRGSAEELGPAAVEPGEFTLFAGSQYDRPQFPFVRFRRDTVVQWVDGWSLSDARRVKVPAQLVFLTDAVAPGDERIGFATSSGAACAETLAGAVLRGLLELCERDAFMITWNCRLSLPLLDWRRHPALRELDRRCFGRSGLEYAAVDLSVFHGIPSVLAVVRAPSGPPPIVAVGASAAATVEHAWWKALSEAFACRAAGRVLLASAEDAQAAGAERRVRSFDDHIVYFARAEGAPAADFLDASPERRDVREVPPLPEGDASRVHELVERVRAAGSGAYAVDVTAPDVRLAGLHVVKVLAPGLCQLDVHQDYRFLGPRRLRHAAAEQGLLPRPLRLDELNPDPHPFP